MLFVNVIKEEDHQRETGADAPYQKPRKPHSATSQLIPPCLVERITRVVSRSHEGDRHQRQNKFEPIYGKEGGHGHDHAQRRIRAVLVLFRILADDDDPHPHDSGDELADNLGNHFIDAPPWPTSFFALKIEYEDISAGDVYSCKKAS